LKGVISFLTHKCGQNVHDARLVELKGGSSDSKVIADLESTSYSYLGSGRLCFDFKLLRVIPTHYSLRTCINHLGCFPTSWTIEASKNGKDWEVIDTKNQRSDMNQKNVTKTFAIGSPRKARFICFNPSGPRICSRYGTDLSAFELFGTLIQDQ
jgi:hypothetical protein